MHAEGNITCRSTVEKLHIWGSPAWILENLMFCKCLGESSIICYPSMKKSADRKLLFLGWEGPGYGFRANCRMKTVRWTYLLNNLDNS